MRLPSGDTQELPMRPMAQSVSGVIRPSFTVTSCLPMMGPSVCAAFSGPTQADVASIMAAVIVIKSVFFMCLFDGLICVTILFCKGKTINGKRGMWQEKERLSMACLYAIEGRSAV